MEDKTAAGAAVDGDAAEALARRESCLKYHGIDKKKDGPSYREVAKKCRDKPDAEARLIKYLRSGPIVTLASGEEDEHRVVKTRDENALRNPIRWILSL